MSDALDAIRALYDTGKYADMKILCEDKVFNVHRAVVCMRSPVIGAAMDDDRWVGKIHNQLVRLLMKHRKKRRMENTIWIMMTYRLWML